MPPFVWSVVGEDANETLNHIMMRKEAERKTGRGEFWWGLARLWEIRSSRLQL
jgi:hypothetical protein